MKEQEERKVSLKTCSEIRSLTKSLQTNVKSETTEIITLDRFGISLLGKQHSRRPIATIDSNSDKKAKNNELS